MNVESKIWNFTTTGTKVHAFKDGAALCRKSVKDTAPEAGKMDFCQVKQSFKSSMCTGCDSAFDMAILADEMNTEVDEADAHPAAGTYYPATPSDTTPVEAQPLVLQREQISAVVYADGSYEVFAGVNLIDQGQLDDTYLSPMQLFTAKAQRWSDKIDAAMAQQAADRAEREAAHHAESDVKDPQTLEEIITMVDALGGDYRSEIRGHLPSVIPARTVIAVLRDIPRYKCTATVRGYATGAGWSIDVTYPGGATLGRYHFMGH